MAKIADKYFKLHPWKIIEEGFDASRNPVSESIYSLANEYMGVRGYFEEGFSGNTLRGSYFNGIYENAKEWTKTAYKGIAERTHFMVNSVDWLYTRILLEDEMLDLAQVHITDFVRVLDLRTGVLERSFVWTTKTGKKLRLNFQRFVSMTAPHEGFQQIEVEALNFSGEVNLSFGLDFNTVHFGKEYYWESVKTGDEQGVVGIIGKTLTTEQRIYSGFKLDLSEAYELEQDENYIGVRINLALTQGVTKTIRKYVSNIVEKDAQVSDEHLWDAGIKAVQEQYNVGYDKRVQEHQDFWKDVWNNFDIEISGDDENQQGIRFCIFQLHQTYHGQSPSNNIGAKGLTGEAYSGHAFWDTETYCLPFYLFNNLKAAKNLLTFRYHTLEQAKQRALALDGIGACYPVATLNGDEGCNLWQHASLQFQPSTGVAYGIWHYVKVSNDQQFLYEYGARMLVEISRFLLSRGAYSQTRNKFGYYAVMGPDEFHMMVNNNAYTNYMAKKTFEYTIEVVKTLKETESTWYQKLLDETNIREDELEEMEACAKNMIIPLDEKTGIYEQHEGYFDLPHIDIHAIPIEEFPLYHHWSYDRIYRTDMIKQPDVLMFMFLYNQEFDLEAKRTNYEYYEPKTIHESSLSPSIHSIFANELGRYQEAFDFFGFATRMDLDNYNRNTGEGLHTTSIAAAWVNIVYGFGGLRSDGDGIRLAPTIPEQWNHYRFRIVYQEAIISVTVSKESIEVQSINDASANITIYNQEYVINQEGIKIPIISQKEEN